MYSLRREINFYTFGSQQRFILLCQASIGTCQNAFKIGNRKRFQLDPNWSLSGSLRIASDRTFLRRYDLSQDDRLRSTLSLERIDADSYFALTGWYIQTLRLGDSQGLQPASSDFFPAYRCPATACDRPISIPPATVTCAGTDPRTVGGNP